MRLVAVSLLSLFSAQAQDPVKTLAAQFQGKVSIYAKNLKTGATYDLNGTNRVNTASTIKLPILIAVFTAEHEGKVHWTDTSELTKDNILAQAAVSVLGQANQNPQLALKLLG